MKNYGKELIKYRVSRAKETYLDAQILAKEERWNSAINRLYYAAYYIVTALLLSKDLTPTTHNGAKSSFSEYFVKTGIVSKDMGKIYSQLFTWRHKGDYADLFDFDSEKVLPYFEPVNNFISTIEKVLK
jgi:uncharacterized protein (UPF0332 family)